jgi:hypothetical protein
MDVSSENEAGYSTRTTAGGGLIARDPKSALSEGYLRDVAPPVKEDTVLEEQLDSPIPLVTVAEEPHAVMRPTATTINSVPSSHTHTSSRLSAATDRDGVLKARISGNWVSCLICLISGMR